MKEFRIEELAEVVSGGTPSTKNSAYWDGEILWVTPKDLSNSSKKWICSSISTITTEGLKNSAARMLPANSVLLSSRAPIGYLALAGKPLCTNQGFKSMICNKDIILPEYLYYYLQTKVEELNNISTGSTFKELSASLLKSYTITIHEFALQQHIVDILGSIDNSIEKSEQIISEIERLIHLQFSVFYGGLTTKSTIGKEFECCLGGTPKTTCPEYWDGNINWINSGEVNKLRICNASKKISQLGMEKSATKLLNRGTTVIAITGATLGQVSLLEIDTCANQSVIGIGENQIKKDFIYPLIMHHISDLIKKQTGGAQQHINMNDVKSLEIMVPTLTQYRDYSFEVMPLFDLQSSLCAKIEKMKELKALYLKKFFG